MLDRLRQHDLRVRLALGLVAVLFTQLLLPIQAHSRLARDGHGLTVVVCTLEGPREIELSLPGAGDDSPHGSAAMAFSDLLNHFTPAAPVVRPPQAVLLRMAVVAEQPILLRHSPAPVPLARDPPAV
jgi:hypothetical protein